MKKLLLLALVVFGGVGNLSADIELYLHNSSNWSSAYPKFENKGTNPSNSSEIIWEYTLNSTSGLTDGIDFYFRLKYSDYENDLGPNWCAYENNNYTFQWKNDNTYNGHWETYTITHNSVDGQHNFWGGNSAFCISHSTVKANEYKITVYANRGNSYHVKVEIVSMPATVSSLGYSTFSCDRALDLDNASTGLTAYKASVSEGKVVLTKATGKVEAGTGLLLAGTTGTIPVVETSAASALDGNLLHGAVTETNIAASTEGAYHYFLAGTTTDNIGFYNLASAADCAAGKAYLETTTELTSDPASSRVSWIFEDEPTGIQKVQAQSENCGSVFNLQGRRVAQPTKGLYIVNGKKVIK